MKRILTTVTALMVFALAFSGMVQAETYTGMEAIFSTSNSKVSFSDVVYANGGSNKHNSATTIYLDANSTASKGHFTGVASMQWDLYQKTSITELYKNNKDMYYAESINYGHQTYWNMYNKNPEDRTNELQSFIWNVNFKVTNTAKKDPLSIDVKAALQAHFYNDWVFFTTDHWYLGDLQGANGVDYALYFELKSVNSHEEAGYTIIDGELYNEIMNSQLGIAAGSTLYGWYLHDESLQHMAFNIGAYGPLANPYATPIPGAVWLLGTGVAGIVAMRRRNAK